MGKVVSPPMIFPTTTATTTSNRMNQKGMLDFSRERRRFRIKDVLRTYEASGIVGNRQNPILHGFSDVGPTVILVDLIASMGER